MLSKQLIAQIDYANALTTAKLTLLLEEAGFVQPRFEIVRVTKFINDKIYVRCVDNDPMSDTQGQDFAVYIEYDMGVVGDVDYVCEHIDY